MNGAESLVRTLVVNGVDVCFTNPGTPGERARDMLTLDRPHLDWLALARGHGVEGGCATMLEELARELGRAFSRRGPYLVELVL